MNASVQARPETNRFIVLPPKGRTLEAESVRHRLATYLEARFPGMRFEFGAFPLDDDFSVFPICGTVGKNDAVEMLAPPPRHVLNDIEDALSEFDMARTGLS